jgi:hypothetical protein
MSRILKLTQRALFILIFCFCSVHGQSADGQPEADNQSSGSSTVISTQNKSVTLVQNLASYSHPYSQGEPLLLLLAGIVIFIGATTAKKAATRKD